MHDHARALRFACDRLDPPIPIHAAEQDGSRLPDVFAAEGGGSAGQPGGGITSVSQAALSIVRKLHPTVPWQASTPRPRTRRRQTAFTGISQVSSQSDET
jgi:hypothetical protein